MMNYDFVRLLSPLDFEVLCRDLLEAELGVRLENFKEGRDGGIDLRHAPAADRTMIVQCKRYSSFASLKSELSTEELPKINRLRPQRYILATSVTLSPQEVDALVTTLSPHVKGPDDIYSGNRLNILIAKYPEVERRHVKLWIHSAGVLDSLLNARTHAVSREELDRTLEAAKLYVKNPSFVEALEILKRERVCIISGQPGIGKTTLARMLLLYFHGEGYEIVKIENDVSEARQLAYNEKPRFYYYDDFLGQTAQADKLGKNEDQSLLDLMRSVHASKNSVLVLTTREYILNQARLHYEKIDRERFDHRMCVVDVEKYSRRIRAQILYNHIYFSGLPNQYRDALCVRQGYRSIVDHANYNPRLIEALTSPVWIKDKRSENYLEAFLEALNHPHEIWGHAFRRQLSDRARHALMVLTTLPAEVRLDDCQLAFEQFHRRQCIEYVRPRAADDFYSALKELDGAFIATRRQNDIVVLRFQNPSIRDFMHIEVLARANLSALLQATVFFEQAQWFSETLLDDKPRAPLTRLSPLTRDVARTMQARFDGGGCHIDNTKFGKVARITVSLGQRLAALAKTTGHDGDSEVVAFIRSRMKELRDEVIEGSNQALEQSVSALTELKAAGYLDVPEGISLVLELKDKVHDDLAGVDDYEILADFVRALPDIFTAAEIGRLRHRFEEFAEEHANDADYGDPQGFRRAASSFEAIGESLGATTDSAQEMLREKADALEGEENSDWTGSSAGRTEHSDYCSDSELDSMFRTLA